MNKGVAEMSPVTLVLEVDAEYFHPSPDDIRRMREDFRAAYGLESIILPPGLTYAGVIPHEPFPPLVQPTPDTPAVG
jgi:hypothetical protein